MTTARHAAHFTVRGVVQGVGFRPFVATLATRLGLGGWVRNESGVVRVLVEGTPEAIAAFAAGLLAEAPPLADVAAMDRRDVPTEGLDAFAIAPSAADGSGRPV
ncbi:MAG: acylphosphatase [Gemmatimonadota bacterium]